jgi:hypothetical protein
MAQLKIIIERSIFNCCGFSQLVPETGHATTGIGEAILALVEPGMRDYCSLRILLNNYPP